MELVINERYQVKKEVINKRLRNDYLYLEKGESQFYDMVMAKKNDVVIFAEELKNGIAQVANIDTREFFYTEKSNLKKIEERQFELYGFYLESDLRNMLAAD